MRILLLLLTITYCLTGLAIWVSATRHSKKKSSSALLYLMLLWPFLSTGIFKRKK